MSSPEPHMSGQKPPLATYKRTARKASSAKKTSTPDGADDTEWTDAEQRAIRAELTADVTRLTHEIAVAEAELHDVLRDPGDGTGDDQADAGAKTFEREQEITLANNSRELLEQSLRALERVSDGSYGMCESCGKPVGKMRLKAFPRATLCMSCKQHQENH